MASAGNPKPHGAASPRTKLEPSLRYRKRSICVSALYLPLLVIPWILTCVMMFRPVRKPSYADHIGTDAYTDEDAQEMGRWLTAAKVMSTIATVIALPVISALLAHAAVRYSQRRREGQTLNLAQLFSLASRGWADIPLLWRTLDPDDRTGSPLLLFGALLVLISELTWSAPGTQPFVFVNLVLVRSRHPASDPVSDDTLRINLNRNLSGCAV